MLYLIFYAFSILLAVRRFLLLGAQAREPATERSPERSGGARLRACERARRRGKGGSEAAGAARRGRRGSLRPSRPRRAGETRTERWGRGGEERGSLRPSDEGERPPQLQRSERFRVAKGRFAGRSRQRSLSRPPAASLRARAGRQAKQANAQERTTREARTAHGQPRGSLRPLRMSPARAPRERGRAGGESEVRAQDDRPQRACEQGQGDARGKRTPTSTRGGAGGERRMREAREPATEPTEKGATAEATANRTRGSLRPSGRATPLQSARRAGQANDRRRPASEATGACDQAERAGQGSKGRERRRGKKRRRAAPATRAPASLRAREGAVRGKRRRNFFASARYSRRECHASEDHQQPSILSPASNHYSKNECT